MKSPAAVLYVLFPLFFFGACSFDYSAMGNEDQGQPDVVMDDVEYVRVRNGDPLVRFRAEHAERYENRKTMELRNFSFEQFGGHGEEINAEGRAGAASVELESGNIRLDGQVRISVDSEDVIIETGRLSWKDKEKILSGDEADEVVISRSDGTNFTGRGFRADARNRIWEFASGISGTYVHEDEEEEEEAAAEEAADGEAAEDEAAGAAGEDGPADEAAGARETEAGGAAGPADETIGARETEAGGGDPAGGVLP
jgi:LPS export ABC transporter protein LptC